MPDNQDGLRLVIDLVLAGLILLPFVWIMIASRSRLLLLIFFLVGGAYLLTLQFQLVIANLLLGKVLFFLPLVLAVAFAPELRKSLISLSQSSPIWRSLDSAVGRSGDGIEAASVEAILASAGELAQRGTGAIIAIEIEDSIDELAITGTRLDAIVSSRLIVGIFDRHNPLHDGAVIIRGNRLLQAGCFLPISEAADLPGHLGTRHRAALGLTEKSDAVVLIVSEERRTLSIAHRGRVALDMTLPQAREQLGLLIEQSTGIATLTPKAV